MFKQSNTNLLLLVATAVLLTLQISSCFKSSRPESYYKEKISDLNSQIENIRAERDGYRDRYENVISEARARDTVLIKSYFYNQKKYEKIPVYIDNLSDDELRRAITDY